MTCVVGYIDDCKQVAWLGAESSATDDETTYDYSGKKIFYVGDFLVGFSGSFRAGQIVRHEVQLPPITSQLELEKYLQTVFSKEIKKTLKKHFTPKKIDTFNLLIAYEDKLFTLENDFTILPFAPYMAIGTGTPYALGALKALMDYKISTRTRITKAIEAAIHHCPSCRGAIYVEKWKQSKK